MEKIKPHNLLVRSLNKVSNQRRDKIMLCILMVCLGWVIGETNHLLCYECHHPTEEVQLRP